MTIQAKVILGVVAGVGLALMILYGAWSPLHLVLMLGL